MGILMGKRQKIIFLAKKSSRSVLQPSSYHGTAELHFYSSFQGYPTCHYWSPMARWPDGHFGHCSILKNALSCSCFVKNSPSLLRSLDRNVYILYGSSELI